MSMLVRKISTVPVQYELGHYNGQGFWEMYERFSELQKAQCERMCSYLNGGMGAFAADTHYIVSEVADKIRKVGLE